MSRHVLSGDTHASPGRGLRDLAFLFLRLGATAFGGPAAHIAMMRDDVVRRRRWMTDEEFLDLLGATNLIPGPNSTEMAIHIGYARAGRAGLLVAGACFILPAMALVLLLAWAYMEFGALPEAGWLLYGVKPVVVALVVHALWDLGRKAVKALDAAAVGAAVLTLYLFGLNEVILLSAGGLVLAAFPRRPPSEATGAAVPPRRDRAGRRRGAPSRRLIVALIAAAILVGSLVAVSSTWVRPPFGLPLLFLTFLKIGSVLYGSGYVLLAFLRADFVARLGWLTEQQILDAVAVGQVTPGPVFTTATFVGYVLGGWPGAVVATAAIFLPSFLFVFLTHPYVSKMRTSPRLGRFLDGVNVAALGLMAGVAWQIGATAVVDVVTAVLAIASFVAVRFRWNASLLILAGAGVGLATGVLS